MKTFKEFMYIAEKYYEPDEKLLSGKTPMQKASNKKFKDRQRQERQSNLTLTKVRHGADNPNPNPHVSREDEKEVEVISHSSGIDVHHKPSGITYNVYKALGSPFNNVNTIEWGHNKTPKTEGDKIKIARDAERVWNRHVSHRIPHNTVAHNSPSSSGSDDWGNEHRNRRERLYSTRGGFGSKDSDGDQFAKVGRNPSRKQQEKGKKRLSPIEPKHLHRHTQYDEN